MTKDSFSYLAMRGEKRIENLEPLRKEEIREVARGVLAELRRRAAKITVAAGILLMISTLAFAMPETLIDKIANAIYLAEGGRKAVKPYGILSIPCDSESECRRICRNTIRNNFKRYLDAKAYLRETYLEFLSRRYAPIGAANDPRGLNQNWIKNVTFFLERGSA